MSVSLRHLKTFFAVANEKNFTKAAEGLCVSQPAVTTTINKLEAMFNTRLFDRTTRSVDLTEEGRQFYEIAQRIICEFDDGIEEIKRRIKSKKCGLSVGCIPSAGPILLISVLTELRQVLPDTPMKVQIHQSRTISELINQGEIDVGIGNLSDADTGIRALPITQDCYGVLVPASHPLALTNEATIQWSDLSSSPIIWNSSIENFDLHDAREEIGIGEGASQPPPNVRYPSYTASSDPIMLEMVRQGIGLAILPFYDWKSRDSEDLVFRPLVRPMLSRQICILTKRGRHLSRQVSAFRDLAVQHAPPPYSIPGCSSAPQL